MSDLYKFRILWVRERELDSDEVYELATDSSQKNMRSSLRRLDYDASQEDKVVRFARYREILRGMAANGEEFLGRFAKLSATCEPDVPESGAGLMPYREFVNRQLLSELFPKSYSREKACEIVMEIVNSHPDAGFPTKRINDMVLLGDWRRFSLRLLMDAERDLLSRDGKGRLKELFDGDQDLGCCDKALWGVEELERIVMKDGDSVAMKKCADRWWLGSYKETLGCRSKKFEFRKLRVVLPVGLFPQVQDETDIFGSTAYW